MRDALSRLRGVSLFAALFMVAAAAVAAEPKLPRLEGIWQNLSGVRVDTLPEARRKELTAKGVALPTDPPYNAEYAARYKVVRESAAQGKPINDPTAACVWPGTPRIIWTPYPIEITYSDNGRRITMYHEYMSQVRRIFADGRPHPEDLEASYNGHTIGRWEGDTLVMDTVGLRGDTMLQNTGMMHSDALRVQERWRLIEPDYLEAVVTMIDPKAFTKPYVTHRLYRRRPDWDIVDYVCEENNREQVIDGVTTNK